MKRLFILLSFFALMGLNCQAQIQNKIYDFVLGQTTKNEVKNYFNLKSEIEFEEDKTDGGIEAYGLRFGGCYWDAVFFSFYKDVLSEVHFSAIDTEDVSKTVILNNWQKLKNNLAKKYEQFYQNDFSNNERLTYIDGKIAVFLEMQEKDDRMMLSITYKDVNLTLTEKKSDEDEL